MNFDPIAVIRVEMQRLISQLKATESEIYELQQQAFSFMLQRYIDLEIYDLETDPLAKIKGDIRIQIFLKNGLEQKIVSLQEFEKRLSDPDVAKRVAVIAEECMKMATV
jgi:hypothetical protein